MAQELAPAEILDAEGSYPHPIDTGVWIPGVREEGRWGEMDPNLYDAAMTGDVALFNAVLPKKGNDTDIHELLLKCDNEGNTCLHLATMAGSQAHVLFVKYVVSCAPWLVLVRNIRGLTPVFLAAGSQYKEIGIHILDAMFEESELINLKSIVMDTDDNGDTAAHHALRNGHSILASRLIELNPEVAKVVNSRSESLMYMACWNGHTHVLRHLLEIPESAHVAPVGYSVLMAAVLAGKTEIAAVFLEHYYGDITIRDHDHVELLICAIRGHQQKIVAMLLSWDYTLGLRINRDGRSAFSYAAEEGNVSIGEFIIELCSFRAALFSDITGITALHIAVEKGHVEFVKFILRTPGVDRLINQADRLGRTPLHLAAEHCRPRIVRALLANKKIKHFAVYRDYSSGETPLDFTALDVAYYKAPDEMRGFNWSEVVTLLSDASCPLTAPYKIREEAKQKFMKNIRDRANSVTGAYRQGTSTVGILITTVTFAAAFTLPGGYISDKGPTEGLPVLARKAAFQAFLISNTSAMCASVMAAFICNMYRLSDLDFVLYYAKKIGYLMWFSYSTMAIAFATGLYTVLAPNNLWLSIFVCVLCIFIPPLSYFFVEWPVLKLDHQMHGVLKINLKEEL